MIIELKHKHKDEVGYEEKQALIKALLKLSKEHNVDFLIHVSLDVEKMFPDVR